MDGADATIWPTMNSPEAGLCRSSIGDVDRPRGRPRQDANYKSHEAPRCRVSAAP
jgi:hypothetical protein